MSLLCHVLNTSSQLTPCSYYLTVHIGMGERTGRLEVRIFMD